MDTVSLCNLALPVNYFNFQNRTLSNAPSDCHLFCGF